MSFLFASSHLPEVKRPGEEEEEEEEEDVKPMQRSGMVRAFSHLPSPVRPSRRVSPDDLRSMSGAPGADACLGARTPGQSSIPSGQGGRPAASPQAPAQGGTLAQQERRDGAVLQGPASSDAGHESEALKKLTERFAAFPDVVESLKGLHNVPTGKLMIEKLATVAHKIKAQPTWSKNSFTNADGMHIKRGKMDPETLGHEFQHLGEILFNTQNPFLNVTHPADTTATGNMDHEYRAMRIQNQLRLERARMMRTPAILHSTYYDEKTPFSIPGSLLPLPAPTPKPAPPGR